LLIFQTYIAKAREAVKAREAELVFTYSRTDPDPGFILPNILAIFTYSKYPELLK
jgi:hypothetical protein